MKKLVIGMMICVMLFSLSLNTSAEVTITREQIINHANNLRGTYYTKGYCLEWLATKFWQALGAPYSSTCCAYAHGNARIVSTSKNDIPIGANVYFSGGSTKCRNNHIAGHVGVHIGSQNILSLIRYSSDPDGKAMVRVNTISEILGWPTGYAYMGWGYPDGVNLVDSTTPVTYSYEFKNVTYPKTFKINTANGWTLSGGTLTCDNQLKTISTKIVNSSDTVISESKLYNISGYTYTIKNLDTYYTSGDTSDNGVRFSKITAPGTYKWIISATDSAGRTLTLEMPFTAVSSGTTATSTASKSYTCTTHSYGSWTVKTAATCTTSGVETRVCSKCGNSETRSVAALGHNYGAWTVITAATCTSAGVETRVCSRDSSHKETRSIAALGHSYGNWTVTTAATCTAAGLETRVCSHDSNHKETRSIAALGHQPGDWTITREATPDVQGLREQRCTRCNTLLASETIDMSTVFGTCGNNATWSYSNGTLTISGSGEMNNYTQNSVLPWSQYKSGITKLVVCNGITSIGAYAFNNHALQSVTIAGTVKTINEGAFLNNRSLTSIVLPEGLEMINRDAFSQCIKLQSVTFPDSLKVIGAIAFQNAALESVAIPANTSLSINPFCCCSKLSSFILTNSSLYKLVEGVIYTKDGKRLVSYPPASSRTTYTVVPGTEIISSQAFYGAQNLTEVIIPDGVAKLEAQCFYNNSIIQKIYLPQSLEIIGTSQYTNFDKCNNLTVYCWDGSAGHQYAVNNNIPYIIIGGRCGDNITWKKDGTLLTISGTGDMNNYELLSDPYRTSAPWGDKVTSVIIHEGVTSIGNYAFYGCHELTKIDLPSSLETIGYASFEFCTTLPNIEFPLNLNKIRLTAFAWCDALTTVTIPAKVKYIEAGAFCNCVNLQEINVSAGNSAYYSDGGTLIGYDGRLINYPIGKAVNNYTVPEVVTSIENWAFANAKNLRNVSIHSNVNSFGENVFVGSTIERIECWDESAAHNYAKNNNIPFVLLDTPINNPDFKLPLTTKTIESEAFSGIAAKRVKLPEGITAIRALAFADCPNLVGVYIPEDCTSIATNAFSGCTNLTIYGHEGSYAEFYAGKQGFAFKAVD